MELSPGQKHAVDMIRSWHLSGVTDPFLLAGLAGTGKTSILKYLEDRCLLGSAVYAAYTGKAASVLQRKGIPASTIHSLIYYAKQTGTIWNKKKHKFEPVFEFTLRDTLENCDCIIIDESSMVTSELRTDLESFDIPILFVGDHGQLPPVNSAPAVDLENSADCKLEQIHRQAEKNPIIKAAMMARNGDVIPLQSHHDNFHVISKKALSNKHLSMVTGSDAIMLCGYNRTREQFNPVLREMHNGNSTGLFEQYDKLICLKNIRTKGLYNGLTGICQYSDQSDNITALIPYGGSTPLSHYSHTFDWAYCLTVHKSQGSEFDSVILFDEWRMDHREKWLYTGITRSKQNLLIVR